MKPCGKNNRNSWVATNGQQALQLIFKQRSYSDQQLSCNTAVPANILIKRHKFIASICCVVVVVLVVVVRVNVSCLMTTWDNKTVSCNKVGANRNDCTHVCALMCLHICMYVCMAYMYVLYTCSLKWMFWQRQRDRKQHAIWNESEQSAGNIKCIACFFVCYVCHFSDISDIKKCWYLQWMQRRRTARI